MFERTHRTSRLISAVMMFELIYHGTVRNIRRDHGNALVGLILNMLQTLTLVAVFFLMFQVLGMRSVAVRGDFLIYIMTGIFLFMTQTKALSSVMNAEGPASAMMNHAPMNTIVSICSAAFSALYIQILSMLVVLFVYHVAWNPIELYNWVGCFAMLLLSWFSGVSFGMVFFALKPWMPGVASLVSSMYMRANMVASGKMFLANQMPGYILVYFSWNPLFHTIDQARGFAFINYNPHFSNYVYPFWLSVVFLMIGLMGEFYTRRKASVSWSAAQ